jgi:hypothetical protein
MHAAVVCGGGSAPLACCAVYARTLRFVLSQHGVGTWAWPGVTWCSYNGHHSEATLSGPGRYKLCLQAQSVAWAAVTADQPEHASRHCYYGSSGDLL